jgi:hypothetical protein
MWTCEPSLGLSIASGSQTDALLSDYSSKELPSVGQKTRWPAPPIKLHKENQIGINVGFHPETKHPRSQEQRAIRLVFTGSTFRIFPTRYSVRYRIVRTFEDG